MLPGTHGAWLVALTDCIIGTVNVTVSDASPSLATTVIVARSAPWDAAAAARATAVGVKVYVEPEKVTVPLAGCTGTLYVIGSPSGSVKFNDPDTAPRRVDDGVH